MKNAQLSALHFFLVLANLAICGLLLLLSRNFFHLGIPLFEEIILASVISSFLGFSCCLYLRRVNVLNDPIRTISYLMIIGLLLSTLVFPYSLVNIDRSRSLYVLSWVDLNQVCVKSGETIVNVRSPESIAMVAISLRLQEHELRGLVIEKNGCFQITRNGKFILGLANLLAQIFKLENWELNKI